MTDTRVFLLPDLGEGLTEAEVVRWLVAEGDTVVVDQAVVEVETAKSVVEVPTPYAGVVDSLHAPEGATVDVGKPLITIAAASSAGSPAAASPAAGSSAAPAAAASTLAAAAAPSTPAEKALAEGTAAAETYREEEKAGSGAVLIGYGTGAQEVTGRRRRPRGAAAAASSPAAPVEPVLPAAPRVRADQPKVASPIVRQLAKKHGVDVARLEGSGRDGLVVRADVEAAIAATGAEAEQAADRAAEPVAAAPTASGVPTSVRDAAPATPDVPTSVPASSAGHARGERRLPMSPFRKAVAANLTRSRAEIPEATVWVDVDATELVALREAARKPGDAGPGLLAYLARFVVAALREHPVLNSRVDTERQEIVQYDHVDLGIAVQSDRGLVVPAVRDAHTMTTTGLGEALTDLTARAREGRLTQEELTGGTFTLNNYGAFNVDGSAAIINHPQVAILGLGRIIDRPWVVDGEITVRKIAQMSFVFDHRVCDGGTAAGFMRSVADAIENPLSAIARL